MFIGNTKKGMLYATILGSKVVGIEDLNELCKSNLHLHHNTKYVRGSDQVIFAVTFLVGPFGEIQQSLNHIITLS